LPVKGAGATFSLQPIRPQTVTLTEASGGNSMAKGTAKRGNGGKGQGAGKEPSSDRRDKGFTRQEIRAVEDQTHPRTIVTYEVVRRAGLAEMERPAWSLWWSGIAAGLSISFSLLAQAILTMHLPDAPWRPLVTSFGYCVGFLMVVLSRQQLFTESTITAVIPVTAAPSLNSLAHMGRLWGIVLAANLAGTLLAAIFCATTPVMPPETLEAMRELSRHAIDHAWFDLMFRGISAGFLVAAMVWLLPGAEGNQFHVITLMTWLIGVGEFSHIIAGSMEAFLLMVSGELAVMPMLFGYMAPVLIGNMIGGTALFAVIAYAQVMEEI
jgi:formate/nitrite transporter FocA (FNT family)